MARLRDGVIKRGKTWSYVIRVTDPETGESRPKWVGGFATEDEAKAARDEARVKARRGEYIDRSKISVREYLSAWIDTHALEIKPKTLEGYRLHLRYYVLPHIGGMRLQAVRPASLTKLYRDLLASGGKHGQPLSNRTVDYVHAILRKAFRDAVQVDQLLASSPADRAKRPKNQPKEPGQVWTPAQLRVFLDVAAGHRLFAFYRLAAYTGARRGELLNLRWDDIDLDAGYVTFTGSTDVLAGERVSGTTKGGRSRVVGIDAETVEILRRHRKQQDEDIRAVGKAWVGEGHVFGNELGQQIYPTTPSALIGHLIRSYNEPKDGTRKPAEPLPAARLHDLRHLHATTLLLAGVPVHVVAARLGHRDPAVTLRVYAHVLREQAAGVADVFAKAVNPDDVTDHGRHE